MKKAKTLKKNSSKSNPTRKTLKKPLGKTASVKRIPNPKKLRQDDAGADNEVFCSPMCHLSYCHTGEIPVCCFENNN